MNQQATKYRRGIFIVAAATVLMIATVAGCRIWAHTAWIEYRLLCITGFDNDYYEVTSRPTPALKSAIQEQFRHSISKGNAKIDPDSGNVMFRAFVYINNVEAMIKYTSMIARNARQTPEEDDFDSFCSNVASDPRLFQLNEAGEGSREYVALQDVVWLFSMAVPEKH